MLLSLRVLGIVSRSSTTSLVDRALVALLVAISSMYAGIVLRELYGLVLNKRDILDDNSTAVA